MSRLGVLFLAVYSAIVVAALTVFLEWLGLSHAFVISLCIYLIASAFSFMFGYLVYRAFED